MKGMKRLGSIKISGSGVTKEAIPEMVIQINVSA
jgi:hypothetical protein